jgi:DNA-binding IclR family transcriptional regulator
VDRRYRLGQRLGNCARVYAMSASVASLVRPCLERLRLRTQETVTVQTRSGVEREVVSQLEGTHTIRAVIDDRRSYPLDVGAAGHVLRAFSSDWREHPDKQKLTEIRAAGFASSRGELMEGAMAIYCPVPDYNNASVQFVVGVQGPEFRLSEKELEIVAQLKVVALELADAIPPDAPIR